MKSNKNTLTDEYILVNKKKVQLTNLYNISHLFKYLNDKYADKIEIVEREYRYKARFIWDPDKLIIRDIYYNKKYIGEYYEIYSQEGGRLERSYNGLMPISLTDYYIDDNMNVNISI